MVRAWKKGGDCLIALIKGALRSFWEDILIRRED